MTNNALELRNALDSITCKNREAFCVLWELFCRAGGLDHKMFGPSESPDMSPGEGVAVYLFEVADAINEHPDKYGKYKAEYDALVADVEAFIEKYSG